MRLLADVFALLVPQPKKKKGKGGKGGDDFMAAMGALGGRKMLYAQSFYTRDEFWALFDRAAYDAVYSDGGGNPAKLSAR